MVSWRYMRLPYRKPGKYGQQNPDTILTEAKFNELKNKLERLKKKQPEAASEVARLAEMGDFSENAEYQLAKGRLRGINQRILELEYKLDHSELICPKQTRLVQIGSSVTVMNAGKEKTYQILGSTETNPAHGIISHTSPIGAALLGRSVGDIVHVELRGTVITLTVALIT